GRGARRADPREPGEGEVRRRRAAPAPSQPEPRRQPDRRISLPGQRPGDRSMTTTPPRHIGRAPSDPEPPVVVVVSAGTGNPSSTRMLADRIAQKTLDLLRESGMPASARVLELGPFAVDIARATIAGFPG